MVMARPRSCSKDAAANWHSDLSGGSRLLTCCAGDLGAIAFETVIRSCALS